MAGRGGGGGVAVALAVMLGALVPGGCGTVPRGNEGAAGAGSGVGRPSATVVVAGPIPATGTSVARMPASATGTVIDDPHPVPTRPLPSPGSAAPAPGSAAIRPTKPNAGPDDPTFTEEDAREYVERHGADGFRMVATGPTTIARVLFVRGADAGWPDYPLLCLVLVRGDYRLGGPPMPGAPPRSPVTSDGITLIFDAHTGNDLGASGSLWATPIAAR